MSEHASSNEREKITSMSFNEFKAAILESGLNSLKFPVLVLGIPHKYIFTQVRALSEREKLSMPHTDPIIGRVALMRGQVRIIIHDGHHTCVFRYIRENKRHFDIQVEATTTNPGEKSLHQLATQQGNDLSGL